jgi:hypothetical protein
LKKAEKIVPGIGLFRPYANLRKRSKKGEQNALSRRNPGSETETAEKRRTVVGGGPRSIAAMGTFGTINFVVRLS